MFIEVTKVDDHDNDDVEENGTREIRIYVRKIINIKI